MERKEGSALKRTNSNPASSRGATRARAQHSWEDLPLPLVGLDDNMVIVAFSDGAAKLFGCPRKDAIGKSVDFLLAEDAVPPGGAVANHCVEHVVRCRTRSGTIKCQWIGAAVPKNGSPAYAVWFISRLPGNEAQNEMSARSERLLATVLENVPIVLWEMDAKGVMSFQDGKGLKGLGLERHALVGKNVLDYYPDSDEFRRARLGEQTSGGSEAGGRMWENWFVPIKDGTEVRSIVGLSLDVTEKKQAEQELRAKLDLIERQREVIRELSVPIIQVWDHVLAIPLTGIFDSKRAAELNEELLSRVTQTQGRFVIMDLTGVDILDTATANRLILLVRALGLLGCQGIITGIRPGVAQAIVDLGVELSGIRTFSLLRDGLRYCMQRLEARRPTAEAASQRGSAL